MSIRIGESWPAGNGHRRWISLGLGDVLALGAAWLIFIGPFWLLWKLILWSLWVDAECAILLFTAALVLAALIRREARPGDITVSWLRWGLFMLDVR